MKNTIEDIRQKIQNNDYVNEEHIRLNIVIRVLKKLGWDIWNPKEVYAEYLVSPDEDKTKVDLALFENHYSPAVFIEIKYLGKLIDKLSKVERQLRNYNRDNTATFSVITDGRVWRLYFSQTGGEFSQKCFKEIDLVTDDIEDIELHFISFLSKEDIKNGNAKKEATKYIALTQRQKAMEDSILQAKRMIMEPPYPSLPECLVSLVTQRGISLTSVEAVEYIKFPPVMKSGPAEHLSNESIKPSKNQIRNSYVSSEDLRFTKVINGHVANYTSTKWNELLRLAVKACLEQGNSLIELKSISSLNVRPEHYNEKGFHPIPGMQVSIQDLPATKVAIELQKIAKKCNLSLYVEFTWTDKSPNSAQRRIIKENWT